MLYVHHGNYTSNWDYDTYFGGDVDEDSVRYLQLVPTSALLVHCAFIAVLGVGQLPPIDRHHHHHQANYMLHKNYPGIVTIAEGTILHCPRHSM